MEDDVAALHRGERRVVVADVAGDDRQRASEGLPDPAFGALGAVVDAAGSLSLRPRR